MIGTAAARHLYEFADFQCCARPGSCRTSVPLVFIQSMRVVVKLGGCPEGPNENSRGQFVSATLPPASCIADAGRPSVGRDHSRGGRRLGLHAPADRGVLLKGIVNPILVVIVHIHADEPPQMGFAQRDDVVEKLSAATSDPAFGSPVLPWCLYAGPRRFQAR